MNPVHDSLAVIRDFIDHVNIRSDVNITEAKQALHSLQDALSQNPPLAAHVEAFCSEVENARASRDARAGGGQSVGTVSPFEHTTPSTMTALERYAREFRAALERKPWTCEHGTTNGCAACRDPADGP